MDEAEVVITERAAKEIRIWGFESSFPLAEMIDKCLAFGGGVIFRQGDEGAGCFLIVAERMTIGVINHGGGTWGFHS